MRWARHKTSAVLHKLVSPTGLVIFLTTSFMPIFKGCDNDIIPYRETVQTGGAFLLTPGWPYLAGLLVVAMYLLLLALRHRKVRTVGMALVVAAFLVMQALYAIGYCDAWAETLGDPDRFAPGLTIARSDTDLALAAAAASCLCLLVGTLAVGWCSWEKTFPMIRCLIGIYCMIAFGYWMTETVPLYGSYIAIGGLIIMIIGAVLELLHRSDSEDEQDPLQDTHDESCTAEKADAVVQE